MRKSFAVLDQRLSQPQISDRARSFSKGAVKDFDAIVEDVLNWLAQPSNNNQTNIKDHFRRLKLDHAEQIKQSPLTKEKAFNLDHSRICAEQLQKMGQSYAAEQILKLALEWQEKALDHSFHNQCRVLYIQDVRWHEAEHMWNLGKTLELGLSLVLGTVHNLDAQDRLHNEEQYRTLALALRKRAFGPDHALTLHTAFELGDRYCIQCKSDDVHPGSKDIFGSGFQTDYGRMPQSLEANWHDAVVRLRLDKPDSKIDNGNTPLVWAASNGRYAVVKLLLGLDNSDSKIDDGNTELVSAASNGHYAVVKQLLAQDAIDLESNINYSHTWLCCFT